MTDSPSAVQYRRYLASIFLTFLGEQAYLFLVGWLSFAISGSNRAVATVVLVGGLSGLLAAPLAGALIDRMADLGRLVRASQWTFAVIAMWLGWQVAGGPELWHVLVAAGFQSMALAVLIAGRQAMLPSYIHSQALTRATGVVRAGFYVARLSAPPIAGWMIATFHADRLDTEPVQYLFYVIAALFCLAALVMGRTARFRPDDHPSGQEFGRSLRDGMAFVWQSKNIRMLLAVNFVLGSLGVVFHVLMPGFAVGYLETGPQHYGAILSAAGFGALVGAVISATLGGLRRGRLVLLAAVFSGLSMAFIGLQTSVLPVIVLTFLYGLGQGVRISLTNALLLDAVERSFLGRVLGVENLGVSALQVVAFWAGHYADVHGVASFLAMCGACLSTFAILIYWLVPAFRRMQ